MSTMARCCPSCNQALLLVPQVRRMVESGELSSDALVFGTHHTVAAWHIVRVMSVGVARWAVNNSEPLLGPVPKADVVTQLKHILKVRLTVVRLACSGRC